MTLDDMSSKMKEITDKLDRGISVPLSDILDTVELKLAREKLDELKRSLRNDIARKTGSEYNMDYEQNDIITANLPAEELIERKKNIIYELNRDIRSAKKTVVDGKEEWVYNGDIKSEGRIDIVLGLPASGKSSTVVNPLSEKYHSRIIDNDEAKKKIEPWYCNGFGADLVHEESKDISDEQMENAMRNLDNIVVPKVGGKVGSINRIIQKAVEYGYQRINLHYVEVPREVALSRMLKRLVTDNRFLDPKLIYKYNNDREGNQIEKVYNHLKERSEVNEYARYNNNVEYGEQPEILEMGTGQGLDIRSGLDNGQLQAALPEKIRDGITGGEKGEAGKRVIGRSGTDNKERVEKSGRGDIEQSRSTLQYEGLPDTDQRGHTETDSMGIQRSSGRVHTSLRSEIQGTDADRKSPEIKKRTDRTGGAAVKEGAGRGDSSLGGTVKEKSNEYSKYNNNVRYGELPEPPERGNKADGRVGSERTIRNRINGEQAEIIKVGTGQGLDIRSGVDDGRIQISLQREIRGEDSRREKTPVGTGADRSSRAEAQSRAATNSSRDIEEKSGSKGRTDPNGRQLKSSQRPSVIKKLNDNRLLVEENRQEASVKDVQKTKDFYIL